MAMVKTYITAQDAPEIPLNPDGQAFPFEWTSNPHAGSLTANELPSLDYAIYLINTVKFHVCQLYHLFDEDDFMGGVSHFYDSMLTEPTTPRDRIRFAHLLLILAFGKALLVQDVRDGTIPGLTYFKCAINTMPIVRDLYEDTLTSMELLCTVALYLQALDHRNSAYTYLGMALRMAMTQGLHREFPADSLASEEAERQRSIWWTIYLLDQKFSSLMGTPSSIRVEDLTVQLPGSGRAAVRHMGLSIHVKLSKVLAMLIHSRYHPDTSVHANDRLAVYGVDGLVNISFLKSMQEILRSLAEVAPELEESFHLHLNQFGTTSRVAATLNLCYHQVRLLVHTEI